MRRVRVGGQRWRAKRGGGIGESVRSGKRESAVALHTAYKEDGGDRSGPDASRLGETEYMNEKTRQ
jgi:hypothetical protein